MLYLILKHFSSSSVLFWILCFYFRSAVSLPWLSEAYGVSSALHGVYALLVPRVWHLFLGFGIGLAVANFPQGLVMLGSFIYRRKVLRCLGPLCALWVEQPMEPTVGTQAGRRLVHWMLWTELCPLQPPTSYVEVLTPHPRTSEYDCLERTLNEGGSNPIWPVPSLGEELRTQRHREKVV